MSSIPLVYDVLRYRGLLKGRLSCHSVFILAESSICARGGCKPKKRVRSNATLRGQLLRNHFGLREEQKVVTAAGFRVCP
jgi:hypothetical protein